MLHEVKLQEGNSSPEEAIAGSIDAILRQAEQKQKQTLGKHSSWPGFRRSSQVRASIFGISRSEVDHQMWGVNLSTAGSRLVVSQRQTTNFLFGIPRQTATEYSIEKSGRTDEVLIVVKLNPDLEQAEVSSLADVDDSNNKGQSNGQILVRSHNIHQVGTPGYNETLSRLSELIREANAAV